MKNYFDRDFQGRMLTVLNESYFELDISTLSQYIIFIEDISIKDSYWIFRGESKRFDNPSSSSISRFWKEMSHLDGVSWSKVDFGNFRNFEIDLIDKFYRMSYSFFDIDYDEKKLEIISLAQHFGLPTRLIDWTKNAMVALYFAVIEDIEELNGYVYCVNPHKINKLLTSQSFDDIDDALYIVEPLHKSSRHSAQDGIFLLQKEPANLLFNDIKDVGEMNIITLIISQGAKKEILEHLSTVGIRQSKLFPDYEGVTKEIKLDLSRQISQSIEGQEAKIRFRELINRWLNRM